MTIGIVATFVLWLFVAPQAVQVLTVSMKFPSFTAIVASIWVGIKGQPCLTLEAHFASRQRNNLDFVRLFAACMVLFGHSFTLMLASPGNPFPPDPATLAVYMYLPFAQGLPGTALHIFFFISGVLVTRSFFHHQTRFSDFVRARVLRIVPAYWVCTLLLACVVGPWLSTLSAPVYLRHPDTWLFVWKNMTFSIIYTLPGVMAKNPFGPSVNGSVWTIPLEIQMYGWVLLLGVLGVLKKRFLFLLFFFTCLFLYGYANKTFIFITPSGEPRLWVFFFFGTLSTLYADKLKISPVWLCATGVLLGWFWQYGNHWFDILGAAWLSYALLVFGFHRYFKYLDVGRIGDFSYGVYLYAFPIQQILVHFYQEQLNGWLLALLALLVTLPLAALSWYGLEKPVLRWKRSQ